MNESAALPCVTCLCPTYGRFSRLRQAVACFLLQDYPNKSLLILNDAEHQIQLTSRMGLGREQHLLDASYPPKAAPWEIKLLNAPSRFHNLGGKRQTLLEFGETPLVAHWDDDDIYLPWHLTHCVRAMTSFIATNQRRGRAYVKHPRPTEAKMVKPRGAWWAVGPDDGFQVRGPCHNVFEGQILFQRETALEFGGYSPRVSGQARVLMRAFQKRRFFYRFDPWPFISYVYRWGDGLHHISGGGDNQRSHDSFARKNTDFGLSACGNAQAGNGETLIPEEIMGGTASDASYPIMDWARETVRPLFIRLLDGIHELTKREEKPVSKADYEAIKARLKDYIKDVKR